MSAGTAWALVGLCALVTAAIKAAGPVALGGRELPERFTGVISLVAPPLLAALVAVSALAEGRQLGVGADTAGVAVAGLALWRGVPIVAAVVIAAGVTALLRAL